MTDQLTRDEGEVLDELGPVDWIVVEFPGSDVRGDRRGDRRDRRR